MKIQDKEALVMAMEEGGVWGWPSGGLEGLPRATLHLGHYSLDPAPTLALEKWFCTYSKTEKSLWDKPMEIKFLYNAKLLI